MNILESFRLLPAVGITMIGLLIIAWVYDSTSIRMRRHSSKFLYGLVVLSTIMLILIDSLSATRSLEMEGRPVRVIIVPNDTNIVEHLQNELELVEQLLEDLYINETLLSLSEEQLNAFFLALRSVVDGRNQVVSIIIIPIAIGAVFLVLGVVFSPHVSKIKNIVTKAKSPTTQYINYTAHNSPNLEFLISDIKIKSEEQLFKVGQYVKIVFCDVFDGYAAYVNASFIGNFSKYDTNVISGTNYNKHNTFISDIQLTAIGCFDIKIKIFNP